MLEFSTLMMERIAVISLLTTQLPPRCKMELPAAIRAHRKRRDAFPNLKNGSKQLPHGVDMKSLLIVFVLIGAANAFATNPFERSRVICQNEGVHGNVCYHSDLMHEHDAELSRKERALMHIAKIELMMHKNRLAQLRPMPIATQSNNTGIPQAEVDVDLGSDVSTRVQ